MTVAENPPLKLSMRFDMRAPEFGADARDLYPAAVEMAAWADRVGFSTLSLSEHHNTADGYLPAPVVLGSALAAVTQRARIRFGVLLLTLQHPLRAAEEIAVLDNISEGRVDPMFAAGYRMEEFAMFGVDPKRRARLMEEGIEAIKQAWTGKPFDWHDTTVLVRPVPWQRPRPQILMGGSIESTARLAARIADDFLPSMPGLIDVFNAERERLGLPPGPPKFYGSASWFLHVAEDPEKAWDVIAPHAVHESNSYAEWSTQRKGASMFGLAGLKDTATIRSETARYRVVTPEECIALAHEFGRGGTLGFSPLMGGLDPQFAWESLELFEARVLPAIAGAGLLDEGSNSSGG